MPLVPYPFSRQLPIARDFNGARSHTNCLSSEIILCFLSSYRLFTVASLLPYGDTLAANVKREGIAALVMAGAKGVTNSDTADRDGS